MFNLLIPKTRQSNSNSAPFDESNAYYDPDTRDTAMPSSFRHNGNKAANSTFLDDHCKSGSLQEIPNEFIHELNTFTNYYYWRRANYTAWLSTNLTRNKLT